MCVYIYIYIYIYGGWQPPLDRGGVPRCPRKGAELRAAICRLVV